MKERDQQIYTGTTLRFTSGGSVEGTEEEMHALILLLAVALSVLHARPLEEEWQLWKEKHGKSYQTRLEESNRRAVWLQNHEAIERHNSHNSTFKLKLNQFGDMVSNMWCSQFNTLIMLTPVSRI